MRLAGWVAVPIACAMLALAGCGSKGGEEAAGEAVAGDAVAGADAASDETAAASPEAAASPAADGVAAPTAAPAATETPAAKPAGGGGDLSAYVGKWPFDAVNGVTWNDNPAVKAAIDKTVTDAAVRKAIHTVDGPASTIELYQGKVASWSCEAHNCGDHQWNVMVDPKSGAADVCYHNEAKTPGQSRWFLASGKVETRAGNCSTE
ncbi:hypothetical protein U8326_02975 [Tsuneonella sp. CC-YZS046]|uniref:hypothetical protein n=1 Tax=Tsuneonella sp. CC-YZS046 TaxID=3042152 RepID=UPI002D781457|nr:hypothetical protein [Tsuneonella sp. CC-YZS046]WRO67146.1 hypothetical protein U8326_02975 [Tsuneonella sp. CC-YZS046]